MEPERTATAERAACEHCGLGLFRQGVRFCCVGCHLAHHLLDRDSSGEGRPANRLLARLVVSAFLAMGVMVFSLSLYGVEGEVAGETARAMQGLARMGALALSVPILLLLGVPLVDAVVSMRARLSAEVLVVVGIAAAWSVSVINTFTERGGVYFDTATMVLVLFTLGRWLDVRARESARHRLELLAGQRVRPATRLAGNIEHEVAPDDLSIGDRVLVRPGESVPVDGVVVEGRSFLETAELTGEAQPRSVAAGDRVWAGSRTVDGALTVRATAVGGERLRDEIARILSEAGTRRSALVGSADRAARIFLPLVVVVALGTALFHGLRSGPEAGLLNSLSVLLIACPCALGLATPLAFWVALGTAWREGILVRGGDVLERLARAKRVFFDKTGTLTSGDLRLVRTELIGDVSEREALELAAAVERASEHPLGRAVVAAWREAGGAALPEVEDFTVHPGRGVGARVGGEPVSLVRASADPLHLHTSVDLNRDGELLARLHLADALRPEAAEVVDALRAAGLEVAALTGDGAGAAALVGESLQVPTTSGLLPQDKVAAVSAAGGRGSVFVGDGLNDAPVLAAADVGISMRSSSTKSLETASVNLMRDDLGGVPRAIRIARAAVTTARVNLVWAFGYNAVGIALAATGRLTPIFAATAMVVSSVLVVLNSARLAHLDAGNDARGEAPGSAVRAARADGPVPVGEVSAGKRSFQGAL